MDTTDTRSRAYCLTINNYIENDIKVLKELKYQYIIIGDEKSTTGTAHLQVYVRFPNPKSFSSLKKNISKAHIEIAKGTPQQNRTYCSKENILFEDGTLPQQGKRNDITVIKELITNDNVYKMRELIPHATSVQAVRMAEIHLKYYEPTRNFKPIVKWYHGSTGSGKTRSAYEDSLDPYVCMETNKWWEGYDGHEHVIIDDIRKDFCKFSTLLKILDRYEFKIETKGGSRQLLSKQIIITCPYHPKDLYSNREDVNQLLRRIDEIKLFGKSLEKDDEIQIDELDI